MTAKSGPPLRPLALPDAGIQAITKRLRRARDSLRGIRWMVEQRADSHAIVQQMSAARGALERAMVAVIVGSLADRLRTADGNVDDANIASTTKSFARVL